MRERRVITKVEIYNKFLTISCKCYTFNFATLASLLQTVIYIAEHLSAVGEIAFAFHRRDGRTKKEYLRESIEHRPSANEEALETFLRQTEKSESALLWGGHMARI